MSSTAFRDVYDLAFQISPIILVGGVASSVPGNMIPLLTVMGLGFAQGALSSGNISLSDFPWKFIPLPSGTLISNTVGEYPFANQAIAGNAVIEQPLTISLQMIAPVKDTGGYLTKLATFTALQGILKKHSAAGGQYHVATPAFLYLNCLLLGLTDITSGDKQAQIEWQWDFRKPLISISSALNALNSKLSKITSGQQDTSSSWTSPLNAPSPGSVPGLSSAVPVALGGTSAQL